MSQKFFEKFCFVLLTVLKGKFSKIHIKTPVLELLFNKVEKETPTHQPPVAASVSSRVKPLKMIIENSISVLLHLVSMQCYVLWEGCSPISYLLFPAKKEKSVTIVRAPIKQLCCKKYLTSFSHCSIHFREKKSILDVWQGLKYATEANFVDKTVLWKQNRPIINKASFLVSNTVAPPCMCIK